MREHLPKFHDGFADGLYSVTLPTRAFKAHIHTNLAKLYKELLLGYYIEDKAFTCPSPFVSCVIVEMREPITLERPNEDKLMLEIRASTHLQPKSAEEYQPLQMLHAKDKIHTTSRTMQHRGDLLLLLDWLTELPKKRLQEDTIDQQNLFINRFEDTPGEIELVLMRATSSLAIHPPICAGNQGVRPFVLNSIMALSLGLLIDGRLLHSLRTHSPMKTASVNAPPVLRKIRKGEPCFYIATIVVGQRGHFVCGACHRHYEGKRATSVRPSVQRPDAQVIQQNINAAWKPASVQAVQQPPRVVATSASYGHAGPDIAVPSSWGNTNAGQPGYSWGNTNAERWAKQAYAVPPAETISLEVSAVREGGNRRKGARGIPFGNICEGKKDVDARIDAPGLIALALDTIWPKIQAFVGGFPWRQDQFIIRDGGWARCAMTFKPKQFLLYVVVPTAQWEDYETWLDKAEEERFSTHSRSAPSVKEVHSSLHSSAAADSSTVSSSEAPSSEALFEVPSQRQSSGSFS
ncbi:hypothetical protein DFH29DRAFT_881978, partial [Suillus ampliporus]